MNKKTLNMNRAFSKRQRAFVKHGKVDKKNRFVLPMNIMKMLPGKSYEIYVNEDFINTNEFTVRITKSVEQIIKGE